MDRRGFILSAACAAFAIKLEGARAQTTGDDTVILSETPPLPNDLIEKSAQLPAVYEETRLVGTVAPSTAEIDTAYDILLNSPIGVSPIEVANYFLDIGAGAYGKDLRPYAREWPVRANPVIFHFFSSTQTRPEGDQTAWCAAFMNWCILRSHAKNRDEIGIAPGAFSRTGKAFDPKDVVSKSTNNASSGSFRCWDAIAQPRRGDIVVFRDIGTDGLTKVCRGTGHVTFFLGVPKEGWVRVMGGNQVFNGTGGAVTIADVKTGPGSRFMKFVAIR